VQFLFLTLHLRHFLHQDHVNSYAVYGLVYSADAWVSHHRRMFGPNLLQFTSVLMSRNAFLKTQNAPLSFVAIWLCPETTLPNITALPSPDLLAGFEYCSYLAPQKVRKRKK